MTEETTHVIAYDVESVNWGSIRTNCLQIGIDIDTDNAAEDPAAQRNTIERTVLDRCQANGHLSEVVVYTLLGKLIIPLNRCEECFGCFSGQAKLCGQIFESICFLQFAGIQTRLHEDFAEIFFVGYRINVGQNLGVLGSRESNDTAADGGVELVHISPVIAVENLVGEAAGLVDNRIALVIIRPVLVAEAFTISITLIPYIEGGNPPSPLFVSPSME